MTIIRKILGNNKGATAIEYGLIAALVAVAAITAMKSLGTSVSSTFLTAGKALNDSGASTGATGTQAGTAR